MADWHTYFVGAWRWLVANTACVSEGRKKVANKVLELSKKEFPNHTEILENAVEKGRNLKNLIKGSGTKAASLSVKEWGELTGEIAFEVVLEVATAGGAAALTTIKVVDKTVDVARVLDKAEDLGDGIKGLEKIQDGAKLEVPEQLGDVVHEVDNVPVLKGRKPKKPEKPVLDENGELSEYGKWYYDRPSGYRSGVRDDAWKAAQDSNGDVFDPLKPNQKIDPNDPWDMGHKPGYEFRKHRKSAAERGIGRKQFLDEHNQFEHYRPELPSSNRSHADEIMDDTYFGN